MKRTIIFSTLFLLGMINASAGPPSTVRESILARAHEGKKGVVVAVTERGDIAADTAWLLAAQVKQNGNFAPLLLVLNPDESEGVLKTLGLAETTLPALIYYDHRGREISRAIGVYPMGSLKQMRADTGAASLN